jgi:uncharacterized protein YecA (UPF0149 family)
MDCRTGEIMSQAEAAKRIAVNRVISKYIKPMKIAPNALQLRRRPAKVGRNEKCPCGSGLKFKHCCQIKIAHLKLNR